MPTSDNHALLSILYRSYSASKGLYTPLFFSPGDYCTAIYSEDEQWYRGRIEADNSDDVRETILIVY